MQERSSHSAPPRECQHPHVPARNYLGGELTTEAYPGTTPVDKQAKETIHKIIQSPCFCHPLPYSARTATLEGGRNDPEHPGPILHAPRDYTYRQTTERNHIQNYTKSLFLPPSPIFGEDGHPSRRKKFPRASRPHPPCTQGLYFCVRFYPLHPHEEGEPSV
jgi:hypothetical protein